MTPMFLFPFFSSYCQPDFVIIIFLPPLPPPLQLRRIAPGGWDTLAPVKTERKRVFFSLFFFPFRSARRREQESSFIPLFFLAWASRR